MLKLFRRKRKDTTPRPYPALVELDRAWCAYQGLVLCTIRDAIRSGEPDPPIDALITELYLAEARRMKCYPPPKW